MKLKSSSRLTGLISRRLFAQRAASAAALVLLPLSDLEAESKLDPDLPSKPNDLSASDWQEVRARHQNLIRVYGNRLSANDKLRALHILTSHQHMLASIRSFSVQNSDPSACTLRVGV